MSERQMRRARERQVEREAKCHGRLAKRGALGAGAALGATVVFAPAAQAANFPVTKLADTNDGTCDADCSLREAVYAANASTASDPDLVTFQSGLSGRIELAASFGDIRIEDGVTIQGPGADVIEVDGNRYDRIFYLDTASPDATTISGLTLLSGAGGYNNNGGALYAASGSGPLAIADSAIRFSYVYGFASDGGAISANNDSLTVTGSEFLGNDAGRSGGALFASTDVTITGSTLTGNDTFYGDGGAIYLDEGSLSVISSRISENQAEESGGGVYVDDTSPADATGVLLRDSVIDRNVAGDDDGGAYLDSIDDPAVIERTTFDRNIALNDGGGVYVDTTDDDGTVTIADSALAGNIAIEEGGGMFFDNPADPVAIRRTTVSGNAAFRSGGGIHVGGTEDDGTVAIEETTISGNTADRNGGGLYLDLGTPVTIQNTTVSGNSASDRGGGVFLLDLFDAGALTIQNSTVAENSAEESGGGVMHSDSGDLAISSSIVAGNAAPDGDIALDPPPYGGEFLIGFSLIENPAGTPFTEDPAGSNITGQDPQLGPLAGNGGPTQTHLPQSTSPALDAGVANGLTADQRGLARTVDLPQVPNATGSDATDIGAVELQLGEFQPPQPPPPDTVTCQGRDLVPILGTPGSDNLVGTGDPDAIFGGAGNDRLNGLGAADCLFGEQGNDVLRGGGGGDLLVGGPGNDKLRGQGGKDRLKGGPGKDKLNGGEGRDRLQGGPGKDRLRGGPGKDRIKGGPGNDRINAVDAKRDRVNCGGGNNDKAVVDPEDKVSANCEKVIVKA